LEKILLLTPLVLGEDYPTAGLSEFREHGKILSKRENITKQITKDITATE
jgi:hypothetical protein